MPRSYEKYLGAGGGEKSYEKYLAPAEEPEDRERIEYEGETFEGTPRQIAILRGTRKPSEEERARFALSGGRPEGAGLSKMRRAKGTGEKVAEGSLRLAGQGGGLLLGGIPGAAAGGAAAESAIRDIDAATGQDQVESSTSAALRGAKEGLITGVTGKLAGLAGKGVESALTGAVPALRTAGRLAGETVGFAGSNAALEGRLPTKEEIAEGALLSMATHGLSKGAGAARRLFDPLRAPRTDAAAGAPREARAAGVTPQKVHLKGMRIAEAHQAPEIPRERPLFSKVAEQMLAQEEAAAAKTGKLATVPDARGGAVFSPMRNPPKAFLSPEDAELVSEFAKSWEPAQSVGAGGELVGKLGERRLEARKRIRQLAEAPPLERPRSVGEEYRALLEENPELAGAPPIGPPEPPSGRGGGGGGEPGEPREPSPPAAAPAAAPAGILRRGMKRLGQALQHPLKVERAKTALGKEVTAQQRTLDRLSEAQLELQGPKENLRLARAEEAAAGAERQEAANEFRRQLLDRMEKAEGSAQDFIRRGRKEAELVFEPSGLSREASTAHITETRTGGKQELHIPSEIARPDWGVTAKALEDHPEVGAILRKHFGDEFVPIMGGGLKRGSHAMAQRERRLRQLISERGPKWAEKAGKGFIEDVAAYMLANPEFRTHIGEQFIRDMHSAAAGRVTTEGAQTVMQILRTRLTGRAVTPELQAAQGALGEARSARMAANAELLGSEGASRVATARRAHEAQTSRTRRARANYSELSPKAPYADFQATWLGGRFVPGPIRDLVMEPILMGVRRGSSAAGKGLERAAKAGPVKPAAAAAPFGVHLQSQRDEEESKRRAMRRLARGR